MGCVDGPGSSIRWSVFTDPRTGIFASMFWHNILVLGLPGARLREEFAGKSGAPPIGPWDRRFRIACRGGPAYASVAVVWRIHADFEILDYVGGDRRIWGVLHRGGSYVPLYVVAFYLPALSSAAGDELWSKEMDDLEADLVLLEAAATEEGLRFEFVAMGDANFQPSELGGEDDPRSSRRSRWSCFRERWNVPLLNPNLLDGEVHDVFLPRRGSFVKVRRGSTRHAARGLGRAIDLVLSNVPAEACIHNGVHCKVQGRGCEWEDCVEYTRGDHFLVTASLEGSSDRPPSAVRTKAPKSWHDVMQWKHAFSSIEEVLLLLPRFFPQVASSQEAARPWRRLELRQWTGDMLAWMLEVVGGLAREGSMDLLLPSSARGSPLRSGRRCAGTPSQPATQCVHGEDALGSATDTSRLEEVLAAGLGQSELLVKCFRLLRPPKPQPEAAMRWKGEELDIAATHLAWVSQLQSQSDWTAPFNESFHEFVSSWVRDQLAWAGSHIGRGSFDAPVLREEVTSAILCWKASEALPPDRLPRAAFRSHYEPWDAVVSKIIAITGPGHLAVRPRRWRRAALGTEFKKGSSRDIENFRFIFIRPQPSLLQETVVFNRLRSTVWGSLRPGQSGYIRDCADAHLVAHEIIAAAIHEGRCIWAILGDFKKAFPKTWRQALLAFLAHDVGVRDGMLSLLGNIFSWDEVVVECSGRSVARIMQGIPEGGLLGPLGYTQLPNSLVKELENKGLGLGTFLRVPLPMCWQGHAWKGQGMPCPRKVEELVDCLKRGAVTALPSRAQLEGDNNLEAAALQALDVLATRRLVALLHADDPFFLGSSKGALQRYTEVLASWSYNFKAEFHVGVDKTTIMAFGPSSPSMEDYSKDPVTLPMAVGPPQTLTMKLSKTWLGILWTCSLDFAPDLKKRLGSASANFAELVGLVGLPGLPLPVALSMFEAKVVGALSHGRWLEALVPEAEALLDAQFEKWARALLGADWWRSGAIATAEVGWSLSGFARTVEVVARRRARLWLLPDGDFYKEFFRWGGVVPGKTWARASAQLLRDWGVLDFPPFASGGNGYQQYLQYVRVQLETRCRIQWKLMAGRHTAPVRYLEVQSEPGAAMMAIRRCPLGWDVLRFVRGWCRVRAQLQVFRAARRRFAPCIFCDEVVPAELEYDHVFDSCSAWAEMREAMLSHSHTGRAGSVLMQVLRASPDDEYFSLAVAFADKVDRVAREWHAKQ